MKAEIKNEKKESKERKTTKHYVTTPKRLNFFMIDRDLFPSNDHHIPGIKLEIFKRK